MRPHAITATYVCCAVLVCCYVASCGGRAHHTIATGNIGALLEKPPQRIPLRAGFFIKEGLARVAYSVEALRRPLYEPPIIEFDVRATLEEAMRRMFTEVVAVSAEDTLRDFQAKNLDVVVSVGPMTYDSYLGREEMIRSRAPVNIVVTLDWAVTSPDGKLVTSTTAVGKGQARSGWDGGGCRDAFIMAFSNQIKKAYEDIVMTAWWRDPSWRGK